MSLKSTLYRGCVAILCSESAGPQHPVLSVPTSHIDANLCQYNSMHAGDTIGAEGRRGADVDARQPRVLQTGSFNVTPIALQHAPLGGRHAGHAAGEKQPAREQIGD